MPFNLVNNVQGPLFTTYNLSTVGFVAVCEDSSTLGAAQAMMRRCRMTSVNHSVPSHPNIAACSFAFPRKLTNRINPGRRGDLERGF